MVWHSRCVAPLPVEGHTMKTLDELQALVNGYKRGSVRFDYLSDVLRELIADAERPWVALAYARLGAVRDRMDPHNVEAVQEFLGPLDASKG